MKELPKKDELLQFILDLCDKTEEWRMFGPYFSHPCGIRLHRAGKLAHVYDKQTQIDVFSPVEEAQIAAKLEKIQETYQQYMDREAEARAEKILNNAKARQKVNSSPFLKGVFGFCRKVRDFINAILN